METAKHLKPICFVAGKSGGHIIPCLTLARQKYPGRAVLFFSTTGQLDQTILRPALLDHWIRLRTGSPRPGLLGYVFQLIEIVGAFVHAAVQLLRIRPEKIVTTGGRIAVPVCMAGWFLRIPFELYELNATPGRSASFLHSFARRTFVCFERAQSALPGAQLCSYPIRFTGTKIQHPPAHTLRHVKTILVLGGSQGSVSLNQRAARAIAQVGTRQPLYVVHQTGSHDKTDWHGFYAQHGIPAQLFAYQDDLRAWYEQADLIICRAGAGSIFEAYFFKKPCIVVPLELRNNLHQLENARAIVEQVGDLFTLVRESEVAPDGLVRAVERGLT